MRQKGRVEVGEDFWPIGFYSEIYFFIPIVAIEGAQMGQKSGPVKEPAEQAVREIRRATRRQFSAEEKIHIVLSSLRGEDSIAELCRREGIVQNLYYLLSLVEEISRCRQEASGRRYGGSGNLGRSRSCAGRPVRSRRCWPS
jgi:Transposase